MTDDANPIVLDEDREPLTLALCDYVKERLTELANKYHLGEEDLIECRLLLRVFEIASDKGLYIDVPYHILKNISRISEYNKYHMSEYKEFSFIYFRLEEVERKLSKYDRKQAEHKALNDTEMQVYIRLCLERIILNSIFKMVDDLEKDLSDFVEECRKERVLPSEN